MPDFDWGRDIHILIVGTLGGPLQHEPPHLAPAPQAQCNKPLQQMAWPCNRTTLLSIAVPRQQMLQATYRLCRARCTQPAAMHCPGAFGQCQTQTACLACVNMCTNHTRKLSRASSGLIRSTHPAPR